MGREEQENKRYLDILLPFSRSDHSPEIFCRPYLNLEIFSNSNLNLEIFSRSNLNLEIFSSSNLNVGRYSAVLI